MIEKPTLHFGIIGVGLNGQHHRRRLNDLIGSQVFTTRANIRLIALADTDSPRAKAVANNVKFDIMLQGSIPSPGGKMS